MRDFKLGLRNILGIIFPGGVLLFIIFYLVYSLGQIPGAGVPPILPENEALLVTAFFIFSYITGSVIRLFSADRLDHLSRRYLLRKWRKTQKKEKLPGDEKTFETLYANIPPGDEGTFPREFDDWIWRWEHFPYPRWVFRKFNLYHLPEVREFFNTCKNNITPENGERKGKDFFNFCKLAVIGSSGESLKEEVLLAEGTTRFFAGTYYALQLALFPLLVYILIFPVLFLFRQIRPGLLFSYGITFFLGSGLFLMKQEIMKRFRRIRLKEVDTVYYAFYQINKKEKPGPSPLLTPYEKRRDLILSAFRHSGGPLKLPALMEQMKKKSPGDPFLSSLYFAGKEEDHPFFLQNDRMALGIALLPEDLPKAYNAKYHEHQKELIIVLEGAVIVEVMEKGKGVSHLLNPGDAFLIKERQCHRVSSVDHQRACFAFIKNNPAMEPRGCDCSFDHLPENE